MPENNLVKPGNVMRQARKMRGFTHQELSKWPDVFIRHTLTTTLSISFDTLFLPPIEKEEADMSNKNNNADLPI